MKKIKFNSKLNLNKIKVSELNNQNEIIGGKKAIDGSVYYPTHTWSVGKVCHSHPVCCLSYHCESFTGICPEDGKIS